jgi:outer membrane protein assembly factor BamB
MRSFEIFFAQRPGDAHHGGARPRTRGASPPQLLDVFIDGTNVTARVAERHASCVLRDLGYALAGLAASARGKAIVRFYDEAWELCVERLGAAAQLSVYRAGNDPMVAVYDRCVPFRDVVESTRDAVGAALASPEGASMEVELRAAADALTGIDLASVAESPEAPPPAALSVEIDRDAPIAIAADFAMRPGSGALGEPSVERADLHALLFRGRVRAEIRGRAVDLGDGHPFLFADRFLALSRRALDAWEHGQPLHVRGDAGGFLLGVRLGADGALAVTLGGAGEKRALYTFPGLGIADVVESALGFGRALARAIVRRDRSQATNLRLSAFRRQLREAADALREACRADAKVNPTPEPYRAFAQRRSAEHAAEPSVATTRLRYTPRWRAIIPGIDLRATFLCGDRLVVGGGAETFCLERTTGEVLWRAPTERATSVVTPGGVARLHADGSLAVHDFGTGEITLRAWVAPRLGGPPCGAVVHVPGLPRLLIVTEGERHLVAIDLTSGEARWRFAWSSAPKGGHKQGALRMKRAGKLLYFASGDSALTALDVLTGAVVWRARDRLRFRAAPTLANDTLFAVAGGVASATRLHALDAFSGQVHWTQELEAPSLSTVEGAPLAAGSVVAVAVRERHALRLVAFDRQSGAPRWSSPAPVALVGTSWLALDDVLVGNTPTGELVAVGADTGELRYRHVLGRVSETDTPRRLEPVLRSGALFVPHADVHVFRPHDGALLAKIAPCDAIPDLLRVDERCDVYVAEESGHLVSFSAGPRLRIVR